MNARTEMNRDSRDVAGQIVWSATPTPFLADGSLDEPGIERLVAQHVNVGVTGLFVGGSCGEGPFMPGNQRSQLVALMKRYAGKHMHITAQVSDTSAARVSHNMRLAAEAGADSVVVAPPWLVGFCNRDFVRRYFFESIATAPLPVGIYVRRPPEGVELDMALWQEVVDHPKVSFLKDSSACPDFQEMLLATKVKRPELQLQTGYEFDVVSPVAAGYDGGLLGSGVLNGKMIHLALAALAAGDRAEAESWQERSNALLYDLFRPDVSGWMAGLKYALTSLGVFSNEFAHLCYPIDAADRVRIDAALEREREYI